ncbi:hybrid sensor histidine kinase/response regulator [Desulfuromusa kysingii]|nr:response regulator [Desulfuromusa kysingii]
MADNETFDLDNKLRDLSVMYELVSSIGTSLDMKTELNQFLQKILKRFGYTSGSILIKSKENTTFFVAASSGFQSSQDVLEEIVPFDHFGLRQLLDTQLPLVKNVLSAADSGYMLVPSLENQIKSFSFLPIIFEDQVLGVLRLFSAHENSFTEKALRMLTQLLKQLGYAINHILTLQKIRQAEARLNRSHERLTTILHSIDASICVVDMETYEVLFMNQNMVDEFGKDYTGETCWKVFMGKDGPCDHCTNPYLLDAAGQPTGIQSSQGKHPITGQDYLNNSQAILWTHGRMARLQISTDITEIKQLEAQLRQNCKMEAIGVMAGGIAHNFNNSLAIILGNLELAQINMSSSDEVYDYLDYAKTAALRSRDLTRQILAYSRQSSPSRKPLSIATIAEETLNLLRATIPTSINLHQSVSSECSDAAIIGDLSLIQESLFNLCNNAVQAMDGVGDLSLKVETVYLQQQDIPSQDKSSPGQYCRISVEDTGCGLADDIMDKIFDPFFTTKAVGQGTGMGLATVLGIIDQHGGIIKVHTELGKGSTFELYFPLTEAPQEVMVLPPPVYTTQDTGRILFVDDDEMLVQLGDSLLTSLGYQVTALTCSTEALELFSHDPEQFDLVISDQTMPELTGLELITALLKIKPDLPAILCTGHNAEAVSGEIASLGIGAFLQKPYELSDLSHVIRKVINNKS